MGNRKRKRAFAGGMTALLLLACVLLGAASFAKIRLDSRYPLRYRDEVAKAAAEFSLPESQVYAIILCESSFRPRVVSSAGAVGLMQILPDTGEWIAQKLGDADFTPESLYDPAVNIRYGCYYLRFLTDLFGADVATVAAAYHAGQGSVAKWLSDPACSEDGVTLLRAPGPATNSYMEKVKKTYAVYEKLSAIR